MTQGLLETIAAQARASPRQRQNYNFHDLDDRVQRFLNVLQPGTYVRPHRHRRDSEVNGFEFFLVLQGAIALLILNEQGEVLQIERIVAHGETRGVELAEGTYHTLIALEPDTVMLEIKEGPYDQTADKEFLEQFPSEGTIEAQHWVKTWEASV
nr:WbuC family cupin fold metalloprotein [Myxacorys almedinensis]